MVNIVGGHKDKFFLRGDELIKTLQPTEARFYELHGKRLQAIIPRYRVRRDMRTGTELAMLPVGISLMSKGKEEKKAQSSLSGEALKNLKYLDVKVGQSFCSYEAVLQHPGKWGFLDGLARQAKIKKRQNKELAYGVTERGFRIVNFTGAPQAPTHSETRMRLANVDITSSLKGFFCNDKNAMKSAAAAVSKIREEASRITVRGALGFIGSSVLFAYYPAAVGQVEAKLIDFAHVLTADIYSDAMHCKETAKIRDAFIEGMIKLEAALLLAAQVPGK